MTMRKRFETRVKSVDAVQGRVTAVVAVFGNVDFQNDRIHKGAFMKSVARWKDRMTKGEFPPVVYGHQDEPRLILGKVVDLGETDEGLQVVEQYFMKKEAARDVVEAYVEGVLPHSSFSYDIVKARRAADGVQDLIELDLVEVGPTLYPANDETRLVGVKSAKGGSGVASDDSAWDVQAVETVGLAADSPAAFFREVSGIAHNAGEPDQAQHWAMLHHKRPGAPANAAAIRNARARFDQTQDLADAAAARRHIFETHRLPSEVESAGKTDVPDAKHQSGPNHVQAAHDALVKAGAKCAAPDGDKTEVPLAKVDDPEVEELRRQLSEFVFAE